MSQNSQQILHQLRIECYVKYIIINPSKRITLCFPGTRIDLNTSRLLFTTFTPNIDRVSHLFKHCFFIIRGTGPFRNHAETKSRDKASISTHSRRYPELTKRNFALAKCSKERERRKEEGSTAWTSMQRIKERFVFAYLSDIFVFL